jgi:hypothetical protein
MGASVIDLNAQLPASACGESFRESRMREIRTYGSMRGEQDARHGLQLLSHDGETRIPRYAEA